MSVTVRPGATVTAEVEVVELLPRGRMRLATRCVLADGTVGLTGEAVVLPSHEPQP